MRIIVGSIYYLILAKAEGSLRTNAFKFSGIKKFVLSTCVSIISFSSIAVSSERNGISYQTSTSGLAYYDYPRRDDKEVTDEIAKINSKIVIDVKGYLAGRNGWQFIDTSAYEDGSIRLVIGRTPIIKGLEIGLIGSDDIIPMKKGDKRRLVIPSRLGYTSADHEQEVCYFYIKYNYLMLFFYFA